MDMAVLLLPPVVENFSDTLFKQNMPSNKKVLKYGGNWKASLSISQGLATISHTPQTQLYIHKKFLKGQLISKCLFSIFNSPKNERKNQSSLLLSYLNSICFRSFFGRIKDISKLTDL